MKRNSQAPIDADDWNPPAEAIWVERLAAAENDEDAGKFLAARHPTSPYLAIVTLGGTHRLQEQFERIGFEYLQQMQRFLDLDAEVLAALEPGKALCFGWLPLGWGQGLDLIGQEDPRGSFWVTRGKGTAAEHTLVLLAGHRARSDSRHGDISSVGGEVGLRIVMHLHQVSGSRTHVVRVTGVSVSFPQAALVDTGPQVDAQQLWAVFDDPELGPALCANLNLDGKTSVHGLSCLKQGGKTRMSGTGFRNDASDRSYSFTVEVSQGSDGKKTLRTLSFQERVTHATAEPAFLRAISMLDPASSGKPETISKRRPTRPDSTLEPTPTRSLHLKPVAGARSEPFPLEGARAGRSALFKVCQSRLADRGAKGDDVQQISADRLEWRSDARAAANAYARTDHLFKRMEAYGLRADDYFKLARLPLIVRHRAGIIPGAGDGNTVNAQVRIIGKGLKSGRRYLPEKRFQVEVRFAAGNLSHRAMLPGSKGRRRAQYLGLAADPRWAWHEFGHVLNAAAIGELELRFAHSTGDALAAVACDPGSLLRSHPRWRYATFPWVFINRRHDRDAALGWSWCGRRYRGLGVDPLAPGSRKRGYFAEQLLSTCLFRLYRCLGGDSDDENIRRSASDYVVYLIMRAIALLGPDGLVPARSVDQFVSALIDADIGTRQWNVTNDWHDRQPHQWRRVGGCAHKVIRWAFEQQGLYASEDWRRPAEGAGRPEPVDLFIPDCRRGDENPDGGYWPVPLQGDLGSALPWHAHKDAVRIDNDQLVVTVRNRGSIEAGGVQTGVWARSANREEEWQRLSFASADSESVAAGGTARFRFDLNTDRNRLQGLHFVVAATTCPADRANIDGLAGLPCQELTTPLIDLIANDNNLAFATINF